MRSLWFLDEPITCSMNTLEFEIKYVREMSFSRESVDDRQQCRKQIFSSFRNFLSVLRAFASLTQRISFFGGETSNSIVPISFSSPSPSTLSISLWYTPWIREGGVIYLPSLSTDPGQVCLSIPRWLFTLLSCYWSSLLPLSIPLETLQVCSCGHHDLIPFFIPFSCHSSSSFLFEPMDASTALSASNHHRDKSDWGGKREGRDSFSDW